MKYLSVSQTWRAWSNAKYLTKIEELVSICKCSPVIYDAMDEPKDWKGCELYQMTEDGDLIFISACYDTSD